MDVLEARFGAIPKSVKNRIGLIDDPELLKMLHGKAVVASSLFAAIKGFEHAVA